MSRLHSREPGLSDPRVASVRHGHDARDRENAAPARTSAARRASALTCLTSKGRSRIAVRAVPGSPPRSGGPHEAGDGLMRELGGSRIVSGIRLLPPADSGAL